MRIAIYARKSTESEDRQVQSLDDQLRILQEMATKERYTVVKIISEAKSAKEPGDRKGFRELVGLIETGRIEGVLTWHINRLTRNLVDGGTLAHLLSSERLRMIRTPERIFRSEDNVLLLAIENGVATSYIHDLRKAVMRGMDSKAARGWKPGRAPLGYLNNWETREIDIDPVRAPLVRKAWDMLLGGGYSVSEITAAMAREGLTKRGKKTGSKPLGKTGFHGLFRNPFYTGQFLYKGSLVTGKHSPLISISEFEQAQVVLGEHSSGPKNRTDTPAAFVGAFTCANCGCAVVHEQKSKRLAGTGSIAVYSYYHCSGAKGCTRTSISGFDVTEFVLAFATECSVSRSFADWCSGAVSRSAHEEIESKSGLIDEHRNALAMLTKRLDALTLAYLDNEVDTDTFRRLKPQVEQEIHERQKTLTFLEAMESQIQEHIDRKLEASVQASVLATGNTHLRRTVLATLGGRHTLSDGVLELRADPVIKKIVSFEPPPGSSQSVKSHDFFPDHPLWWALADDIRKVAQEQIEVKINKILLTA